MQSLLAREKICRTTEYRQGEHAECGLTALAITMAFYGVHKSLAQLRSEAGSTLFGSTLRMLRDLAQRHGFAASAHRIEPEDMAGLGFPLIAHSRFIHFVVVEGVSPAGIHINDPGSGPEIVAPSRFSRDFTGIVLKLVPDADAVRPQGEAFSAFKQYGAVLRPQLASLVFAAGTGLFSTLALGAAIRQMQQAVDLRLSGQGAEWLWLALFAVAFVADGVALHMANRSSVEAARRLARTILSRVHQWPIAVFILRSSGQAAGRARAPLALAESEPLVAVLALMPLVLTLVLPPFLDLGPGLGLACLTLLQAIMLVANWTKRGGALSRYGRGDLPVQAFAGALPGQSDWWRVGLGGQNLFSRIAGEHAARASKALLAAGAALNLASWLRLVDGLKYGGLSIIYVQLNADSPAAALSLFVLAGIGNLALARIERGLYVLPHKDALIRLEDHFGGNPNEAVLQRETSRGLELHNVEWRAAQLFPPVVEGLNARCGPGEILAISGQSGDGLSVVAKMCAGLLAPSSGEVSIDGVDAGAGTPGTALFLDHQSILVPGTLRENMTLGDEAIDDEALRSALEAVDLWSALAPRQGLNMVLDEQGSVLSGGQRHRLALARALCRQPRVLVLDGTLDSVEPLLAASIMRRVAASGIALVLTSRRKETLALADRVLDLRTSVA